MRRGAEIWTFILVTVITVLVWTWAAAETRSTRVLGPPIQFQSHEPDLWLIEPGRITLNAMTVEGSPLAVENVSRLLKSPITLVLGSDGLPPPTEGLMVIELDEVLREVPELRATGASIVSIDPSVIELQIDQFVTQPVPVRGRLTGIEHRGLVTVTPSEAILRLPNRVWQSVRGDLVIEAVVEPWQLDEPIPGETYEVEVTLRKPPMLAELEDVEFLTRTATVTFTATSRVEVLTLDSVRVQVQGPPENFDEYRVVIDERDRVLRNVTIQGDAELIRLISHDVVKVMALLHLTTQDKDSRIDSKQIAGIVAVDPQGSARFVEATYAGSPQRPVIRFEITEREPRP